MLPICENCKSAFSWKQLAKSLLHNYQDITCENCRMIHVIDFSSRFIFIGLGLLPALAFATWWSPFNSSILEIIISLVILVIGFLMTPYFIRYKKVKIEDS